MCPNHLCQSTLDFLSMRGLLSNKMESIFKQLESTQTLHSSCQRSLLKRQIPSTSFKLFFKEILILSLSPKKVKPDFTRLEAEIKLILKEGTYKTLKQL